MRKKLADKRFFRKEIFHVVTRDVSDDNDDDDDNNDDEDDDHDIEDDE